MSSDLLLLSSYLKNYYPRNSFTPRFRCFSYNREAPSRQMSIRYLVFDSSLLFSPLSLSKKVSPSSMISSEERQALKAVYFCFFLSSSMVCWFWSLR